VGEALDFGVELDRLDDSVLVRVVGELDLASSPRFDESLTSVADGSSLVIYLSACTFIDSSGMRAIADAASRASRASIVATEPAVLRALELSELHTMLPVHPSVDDAR
jgi:anti-anti-sigma factor